MDWKLELFSKTAGLENIGSFNNFDVRMKFVGLQCSWVKKLYDNCFPDLKIILSHLLAKYFDSHFKFHSSLC